MPSYTTTYSMLCAASQNLLNRANCFIKTDPTIWVYLMSINVFMSPTKALFSGQSKQFCSLSVRTLEYDYEVRVAMNPVIFNSLK